MGQTAGAVRRRAPPVERHALRRGRALVGGAGLRRRGVHPAAFGGSPEPPPSRDSRRGRAVAFRRGPAGAPPPRSLNIPGAAQKEKRHAERAAFLWFQARAWVTYSPRPSGSFCGPSRRRCSRPAWRSGRHCSLPSG